MKTLFFTLFIAIILMGCNQSSKNENTASTIDSLTLNNANPVNANNPVLPAEDVSPQVDENTDFFAAGSTPSWRLEIDLEKAVHFKTDSTDMTMSIEKPTRSADGNTTRYQVKNGNDELIIELQKKECINELSGERSDYGVSITAKGSNNKTYNGCGRYVSYYRLNDVWALEAVNNRFINPADFSRGTPYMQLNIPDKTMRGFAGCNGMSGNFTVTAKTINFGKLATAKSPCPSIDIENKFLKYFSGQSVPYELRGGKLFLKSPSDSVFIYHKMQ